MVSERWWWQRILDREFFERQGQRGDPRDRARRAITEHQAVADPPEFTALLGWPALRAAAQISVEYFRQWESLRRTAIGSGSPESLLNWSLMKQVAEDVAFDRHVSPDAVQARIVLLSVQGTWWRRQSPGVVLCSPDAAADPVMSQALMRDAFDSHVRHAQSP